ncbi:MAG: hypothetical protein Q7T66_14865 [Herminiimonas sp.]|uniref:hypothetical protein n=1 Tax=Herminiimonas sp. TaxID=1926289 RepID=UPI00271B6C70|nr:hypothetical protein [Herminiimonas sp.]MDO9421705.1 hypothetical protein [Herminiimonas sp.]MDO9421940.1 hypothetical protein [Herminiimonas sp.]
MSIIDLIVAPGTAVGCVIGIAIAVGLNWLFPEKDLITPQALVVVATTAVGMFFEFWPPRKD